MKNVILLILMSGSSMAADIKSCETLTERINNIGHMRIGTDGCNDYGGGYFANTILSNEGTCKVEISFNWGGTQIQCSSYFPFLEKILDMRVSRKVRKMYKFCHHARMSTLDSSNGGRHYTIVCE